MHLRYEFKDLLIAQGPFVQIYTQVCVAFQVFKTCGDRGEEGTPSSISEEPKKKGSTVTALEYKPSPKSAARLEVQVCVAASISGLLLWVLYTVVFLYTVSYKCVCNSQVTDVSSKLKEMQFYWIQLPSALCSGKTASTTGVDKCWNGITKARYYILGQIFSFYNEMCPLSWSVHVICS